ncbi:MAG: glutamine synthetase III [Clostridia bacterium]|nr:glutamine synthetase III [Clostridia bacterium]
MASIPEMFGSMVFNEEVMKKLLPCEVYENLKKSINENSPIDVETGEFVARAMKSWAIEKGATHFTHWFQPLTEITAEKHNSFLEFDDNGNAKMSFSVKELIKGESDASSLPSGGLRETFEARGYTSWDPTSYAFVKNKSLYIPTFFCSYSGEVLDEKTPLLKSMYAVNKQALRVLKILGNNSVKKVTPSMGAEQEYFLIDKEVYKKRKDIIFCGRTLFGAKPVKAQDLSDHYFTALKPRVSDFMQELDEELWKLGVPSKTKHNEVAPAQHEVAQIHTFSNHAADQNHIIMETLKQVAEKHNLVCLLHEKPFKGINGSGKHNNWSLSSDTGVNLFEPGISPRDNAQFLVFLCAMIKAVDEYADLLRISISSAGNDCRLGGDEAPPSIVSVYLGEDIMEILESIEEGKIYNRKKRGEFYVGLDVLPAFPCDTSDRNRTSPFAFTGNKFEFRMVGSAQSIAATNMILNIITAQSLKEFADELEKSDNIEKDLNDLLQRTIKKHKRVIFNGNSYSKEWEKEANSRGLCNYKTTVDALKHSLDEKNVKLFTTHKVLSHRELVSRCEIHMENYCKVIHIEAKTMINMVKNEILPAVCSYTKELSSEILNKNKIGAAISSEYEMENLKTLSDLTSKASKTLSDLIDTLDIAKKTYDLVEKADKYKKDVLENMNILRNIVDTMEFNMPRSYWPYPTYDDILFSV